MRIQNLIKTALAGLAALALCACERAPQSGAAPASAPAVAQTRASGPFTILAGSELKDMEGAVKAFAASKGYEARFEWTGTLDAVDRLSAKPEGVDALWVSHGKYISMAPATKALIKKSEKTMYSRVVIGVKPEKAKALGLQSGKTAWRDLATLAKQGKLQYAMTNPTASNTGFVALVGLAAELSGKGDALEAKDIPSKALAEFFKGQSMTSGSSGALADMLIQRPESADAIINYESVIKGMAVRGLPMEVIYPKEGVITADYPLMLLSKDEAKARFYDELILWLRSDQTQNGIVKQTGRDPLKGAADAPFINELPFPGSLAVVDAVLDGFLNEYSQPITTIFVLDTSGSMNDHGRMGAMKSMMLSIAGDGASGSKSARFAALRLRERAIVLPFSNVVRPPQRFDLGSNAKEQSAALENFRAAIGELTPGGGTAIYDAMAEAQMIAERESQGGKRRVSVVLLTDGENTQGMGLDSFKSRVAAQGQRLAAPIFPIVYGEASMKAMQDLAALSGGKAFDGRKVSLAQLIKEIRSWQ